MYKSTEFGSITSKWQICCKSAYKISMYSICLKYLNDGEVGMQYILIQLVVYFIVTASTTH